MATRLPLQVPVNTTGLFRVKTPFTLAETVIYTVEASRTFPDLVRQNIDVYNSYYQPVGLGREEYLADANVSASILTFKSRDGQVVYIPDTYLESYPGLSGITYQRNVLVVDLALVPDYVKVSSITKDVSDILTHTLGIEPKVEVTTLEYEGKVTEEQHLQMEAARKNKIRESIPLGEKVAALTEENKKLKELNNQMLEILKANGLVN
ncbi:hypothetical protein AB2K85_000734 [Escherichia coli]